MDTPLLDSSLCCSPVTPNTLVPYPVSPSFLIFLLFPHLLHWCHAHLDIWKTPFLLPLFSLSFFLAVTVTSELHMQLDAVRCPSCSRPHSSNLQTSNNNDIGSSHYLCPQSMSLEAAFAGSPLTVIQTKPTWTVSVPFSSSFYPQHHVLGHTMLSSWNPVTF